MFGSDFSFRKIWEPIGIAATVVAMMGTPLPISIGIPIIILVALLWAIDCFWVREPKGGIPANPSSKPDIQASTCLALRSMMTGPEERVFISMLQNGELSAWAMTKGYPNLRPVDPKRWINDTLAYIDDGKSIETTIQNPNQRFAWVNGGKAVVNNNAYDIHFNRDQLKRHWPTLF